MQNINTCQLILHTITVARLTSMLSRIVLIMWLSLQEGLVYAVEFSHRSGRDLINVAKKRTNIIPIIEDARHPHKYRMLVGGYTYIHSHLLSSGYALHGYDPKITLKSEWAASPKTWIRPCPRKYF